VWIRSGRENWLFRLFGTRADRNIGTGDNFPDRLLEFLNPLLDFAHEKEGVELKKDFDIDMWTRAAGTDFMESIVVVEVLDKLRRIRSWVVSSIVASRRSFTEEEVIAQAAWSMKRTPTREARGSRYQLQV